MAIGRVRAALGLSRRYLLLLSQAKAIYTALESNPSIFVSLNPPLPTLLVQIQDCEKSQQLVGTRVKGFVFYRSGASRAGVGVLRGSAGVPQRWTDPRDG